MERANAAVNYAKGLAIILMVLLHSSRWIESGYVGHFVCLFHMPLFFIMSGFCFKEKYLTDFKTFVIKRIKGLWGPYFKYGVAFLLLHNVFYHFHIYDSVYGSYTGVSSSIYGLKDYLMQFQRILRMVGTEQLLGGFWFLHALFYASIIGCLTICYTMKRALLGGVLLLLTMFFLVANITIPIVGIGDKCLLGALFFYIGFALKKHYLTLSNKKIRTIIFILTICVAPAVAYVMPSSMPTMSATKLTPYILSATLLSTTIFLFLRKFRVSEPRLESF